MNSSPVRVAVIGVVASLLLGGCGADEASPDAATPAASSAATTESPSPGNPSDGPGSGRDRARNGASGGKGAPQPGGSESAGPDDATSDSTTDGSDGSDGDGTAPGSAPALEMPEAPESPVSSLSELLAPTNPAPLVTTPLPRGASAEGRLVRQFPDALRPTRAARVQSSSLSPTGDRLQVGLVATTSLSADQVLLAYRTRLARRGLDETAAPPSVAGSRAAAFRRGDSVVTVTVTPQGSRTSYAVHASLRAADG
ncbi:hypothetical protein NYO98_11880 [Nocardioides sp. STR2]|uniref:Uncharacterized protein n=1 Tax=Nocardioides pini TaxID=2975053 RepID=A0ABT4CDD8_9ACTN|nr:hypothetical protein [Nocardioides pini]MCY4726978.1 hypothetical protein [Nocardioides pini]